MTYQQPDGSWIPLWFGNQARPGRTNPVIGTSLGLGALEMLDSQGTQAARGGEYLLQVQNADGGWGGAKAVASSVEETALAVAALAPWAEFSEVRDALSRARNISCGRSARTSTGRAPIGLYFSHLWYSEKLYPLIWTVEALGRLKTVS